MKKYKLSDFNLIKQSLRRKLNEIVDDEIKENVRNILNERTTEYNLDTIEYILDVFYSDEYLRSRKKAVKPLSLYYKEQNRKKYSKLKTLILIKRNNPTFVLEKEICDLFQKSKIFCMDFDEYNNSLDEIADKFGILPDEVYKINNRFETEWLNKIIT